MSASATSQGVRVEVRDLRKSLGGVDVLKGISFQVNAGERFVIMGPSGSGKSVLLKHIIGLMQPDSGEVLIEGLPVQSAAVRDQYRMAMVFQSGALLSSLTVGENVGLYLTEHALKAPAKIHAAVMQALEAVGLQNVEARYPSELSGGMQKRVAIARALIADPQMVLFDEPTSELDPVMAVTIGEEILKLNQRTGATSIIVTHDRGLAYGAGHRIAMINEGRIMFIGTPTEVRQSTDPVIQEFIRAELETPKAHR
jgi:phospholipid/cholesterol/gamma-HCH transport system ATP-binding protein